MSAPNWQVLVKELKQGSNKHCADCMSTDTEWASINLGVFICITCSAVHRSLGTHISKIRSLTLDEWDEESYMSMKKQGNTLANSYWECNLMPFEKPLQVDPYCYRQKFIVDKYIKQNFIPSDTNKEQMKFERST